MKNMLREETKKFFDLEGKDFPESKLGALVFDLGIIDHPELLARSVIETKDEVEYLIDQAAAEDLKDEKERITLFRMYDHKEFSINRYKVIDAIKNGSLFDQLD